MSLDPCKHEGVRLPDKVTCAVRCQAFPACVVPPVAAVLARAMEARDTPDAQDDYDVDT